MHFHHSEYVHLQVVGAAERLADYLQRYMHILCDNELDGSAL